MLSYSVLPRVYFAARRFTTNQTITNANLTRVIFNDKLQDTHNQYNESTGLFTCSIAGFYSFVTSVRVEKTVGNITLVVCQFSKNNLLAIRGQEFTNISVNFISVAQTYGCFMNIGDTLALNIITTTTDSTASIINIVNNDFELAHFSGFRVA